MKATLLGGPQVFYAAVQAILYVLCYHLSGIMSPIPPSELQPGLIDASSSKLVDSATLLLKQKVWPLLSHRLAPLVVCLPSVVAEFGQQATALGLMECLPLIPNVSMHIQIRISILNVTANTLLPAVSLPVQTLVLGHMVVSLICKLRMCIAQHCACSAECVPLDVGMCGHLRLSPM